MRQGFPVGMSNEYWGGGGGVVAFIDRQPACVITTYSIVLLLLQIFPGWMMGPISDAAAVCCVRVPARTCTAFWEGGGVGGE